MKVFIVEDDTVITEGLTIALTQEGYEVAAAPNMTKALDMIQKEGDFDICLLDVMLPDGDGFQVCRAIRKKSDVPILFLTARDDEVHTVLALEQGADDYIAKPFRIRELTARMKAVLRRSRKVAGDPEGIGNAEAQSSVIKIGRNELNMKSAKVMRDGEEIFLSAVEYRLLLAFVAHRGQVLTRHQILSSMWDQAGEFVNDNTLTVYVRRLRRKLEEDGEDALIKTVRGIGYRLD